MPVLEVRAILDLGPIHGYHPSLELTSRLPDRPAGASPLDRRENPEAHPSPRSRGYFNELTSSVTLLIFPVNRVSAPMPMPSATGVWLSMPTSAVSSAEKTLGWVLSTRPSATGFPFTYSVALP